MNSLIIGAGEVGKALQGILKCEIIDKESKALENFDVIHICFPYSPSFISQVKTYQKKYKPFYTLIHSTVPIGTCEKVGSYHCPIRGMHPNLENSMLTFVAYLAPHSTILTEYLNSFGFKIKQVKSSRDTEALKLFDTLYYFWNIIFEKEVYSFCKENKLDFNVVYTQGNKTYNEGYEALERRNVIRPVLSHIAGPVGGHCLVPNAEILKRQKSRIARILVGLNKTY